jgi:hypothetical protein
MSQKMKLTGNLMAAHKFQQFWAEERESLKALSERIAQTSNQTPAVCPRDGRAEEALLQSIPTDGLKSDIVFNIIKARMDEEPDLVRALKFVIQFNITRNGKVVAVWSESSNIFYGFPFNLFNSIATDTKAEGGQVYRSLPKVKPDAIVNVDDENYVKILFGKLNPQRVSTRPFNTNPIVFKFLFCPLFSMGKGFYDRKDRS